MYFSQSGHHKGILASEKKKTYKLNFGIKLSDLDLDLIAGLKGMERDQDGG
jgi:hypothetical protein